ncbi:hypothetical protein AA313_de0210236 [Arthrobotrys entomopaga]|nr:hypothetical protein AA313_de0210236 [Arthrobotrys entomopaga]
MPATIGTLERLLHNFLLGSSFRKEEDFQRLYNTISEDDTLIKRLLERCPEKRHFREAFLANPDDVLPRLASFLKPIKLVLPPRNTQSFHGLCQLDTLAWTKFIRVLETLIQYVILDLANEPHESFDHNSGGYQYLVHSVLEVYIPLATYGSVSLKYLRELFSKILNMPGDTLVLEKIVTDEKGASLIKIIMEDSSLIRSVLTRGSLRLLGSRLARQIRSCIASHGDEIEDAVALWDTMESVSRMIETQIAEIERTMVPSMARKVGITVDTEAEELLKLARVAMPYNLTTAKSTVEVLWERYQDLIHVMLSSFPCSTCQVGLSKLEANHSNYRHTTYEVPTLDLKNIDIPLGAFPIHLSEIAMQELKSARVGGTLPQILPIIQKLADGCWEIDPSLSRIAEKSRKRRKEPVLRSARWCTDGYILWERGIGRVTPEAGQWIQIVRVLRIGSASDLKAAVSAAQKAQRAYSEFYRDAAALRLQNPDHAGVLIPKHFIGKEALGLEANNVSFTFMSSASSPKLTADNALILHKALCIGKQYSLTRGVVEMISQGGHQAEVPFVVSAEEESIISNLNSSICILGRSGTGKTTCLVFRLLANYLRDEATAVKEARQIFLTRSPVLAEKIRQYTNRLIRSRYMHFTQESGLLTDSDTEDVLPDVDEGSFSAGVNGLLDVDNHEWPLICTFDTFADMLERSLQFARRNSFSVQQDQSDLDKLNRRVDYGKFCRSYWPSFSTSIKKDLSADCVFSEIMGL